MSDDAERQQRILEARARLVTVLGELTGAAAASAPARCPYRAMYDACTFRGGCRNQLRDGGGRPLCSGATLNPARAR